MKKIFFAGTLFLLLFSACDETKISSLFLTNWSKTLIMGQSYQIEVTVYPLSVAKNAVVSWSSSDAKIATVSSDGTVTALTPGVVVITASSGKAFSTCEITVKPIEAAFDFKSAALYFYGDIYGKGSNCCLLRLFEKEMSYDDKGGVAGNGYFMNINLNLPVKDSVLIKGEYKSAKTREKLTFFAGVDVSASEGTFLGEKSNQGIGALFVKEGTFSVENTGAEQTLSLSFTGASGQLLRGSYLGVIEKFDLSGSKLEKKELNFSSGKVIQMGDVYHIGYKVARLKLKNESDSLQLDFNLELSVSNAIPVGTYSVSEQAKSFSLSKGATDSGVSVGCWLLGAKTESIDSGVVVVSKKGSEYLISYTLNTQGVVVKGNCQGVLTFG